MVTFCLLFILGCVFGALLVFFWAKAKISSKEFEVKMLKERMAFLDTFKNQMSSASFEALKQTSSTFLQLAEQSFEKFHERAKGEFEKKSDAIDGLVKPVKEALEKFDGKILELEKARTGAYASLKEQVQALFVTQKELKSETANLVKALRAPTVRGRWGEMQLKRVVEMAGMTAHCDFFEQVSVHTEEGKKRPDLLVKLPAEKHIVVDAKAPLEAYLEAIECPDDEKKRQKMKEHAGQIRAHMQALSRKTYWEQFQPTPEFVVLFLPGETFFSAALEQDPSLIEVGVEQKVILATPTTLIALLRAVAYGWRQESVSKSAEAISALGRDLYKRIGDMTEHFSKVGKSLTQAVLAFNRTVGSFESRVLVSARRFMDLNGESDVESPEPIEALPRSEDKETFIQES